MMVHCSLRRKQQIENAAKHTKCSGSDFGEKITNSCRIDRNQNVRSAARHAQKKQRKKGEKRCKVLCYLIT